MRAEEKISRTDGADELRRITNSRYGERNANGLGLLSLGLGLAQVLSPRDVARMIGARDDHRTRSLVIGIGVREIANGLGILSQKQPAGWVWARVAGDLLDLALLARTHEARRLERRKTRFATAAVLGVTLLDALSAIQLTKNRRAAQASNGRGFHVTRAITINRRREDVYQFWRNLENLPMFMAHLESVQVLHGKSVWRAHAPAHLTVEWQAEIVSDRPNESIAWRSLEGSTVPNTGFVRFVTAPGGRGTEVRVELAYRPPGGKIGKAIATLFGEEPGQQIEADLRRLKQVLETGEVVHSDASIHRGMHPARPPNDQELRNGGAL